MAHRGVCPDMACELWRKNRERYKTKTNAAKDIGKQLGVPHETARSWIKEPGEKPPKCEKLHKSTFETCAVSDLQRLIDAGKKFGTIYCDAPWSYSNQGTRAATDNHYDTLTPADIAELPIKQLAADQAHLHFWTTNAFIFECPRIFEAWGFEYKTMFVWTKGAVENGIAKAQLGIGNYWRVCHEFLVTGIRGDLRFHDKNNPSWILQKRSKHSAKPERVAGLIEQVSPGPYLELFGRRTRDNWTVWGNEIDRTLFNEAAFEGNLRNREG